MSYLALSAFISSLKLFRSLFEFLVLMNFKKSKSISRYNKVLVNIVENKITRQISLWCPEEISLKGKKYGKFF